MGIYLTVLGGWKDATQGRFHRKAFDLFQDTGGVTSAKLYLLMGEGAGTGETFPNRPYGNRHPVHGSIELSGAELEEFLGLWELQEPDLRQQALCHQAAYGFRLYRGGRLVGETSVCWKCSNYYVTVYPGVAGWYGFAADSGAGQALLAFCDARLPYPRTEGSPRSAP